MNLLHWCSSLLGVVLALGVSPTRAEDATLSPWRAAKVRPVSATSDRHVIHAYFNTSPESPDGRYVLYYTSDTSKGEQGDLRIRERSTGEETIIATDIVTEDAHRAACQQWSNGGKTVLYHNFRDGHWQVLAVDVATKQTRVLAEDHQLGFGSPMGVWAPVYGCHWNPGPHRDLELVHVETGEVCKAVTAQQVVAEYGEWIQKKFGTTDISIFFPVMSSDGTKVFFKVAKPSGTSEFRSSRASIREGKVIYDLQQGRFIRLVEHWGHPSWTPDSTGIFEKGNFTLDVATGRQLPRFAPSCFSDHPTMAPDGKLFVTDADVSSRPIGKLGHWAVAVGSTKKDEYVVLQVFDNSQGAKSWRRNHPHPAFSADGKRVYFNVNAGPWTRLMVAEAGAP